MDKFKATHWCLSQLLVWIWTRDKWEIRRIALKGTASGDIDRAAVRGIRKCHFVMAFDEVEKEAIEILSRGQLRAWGRRNGKGKRKKIPTREWPDLEFYPNGMKSPCWPERSTPHVGRPDNLASVRAPNQAAGPPFWTEVIFEREEILKFWHERQQTPITQEAEALPLTLVVLTTHKVKSWICTQLEFGKVAGKLAMWKDCKRDLGAALPGLGSMNYVKPRCIGAI